MRSKLDEVSDPAYRHKIRGDDDDEAESELSSGQEQGEEEAASDPETFKEKKHRDMLCEKHEVSDEELWQQLHDVQMMEVRGEEHMEVPTMEQETENERNKPHYWDSCKELTRSVWAETAMPQRLRDHPES